MTLDVISYYFSFYERSTSCRHFGFGICEANGVLVYVRLMGLFFAVVERYHHTDQFGGCLVSLTYSGISVDLLPVFCIVNK